jgi:hypothetical protein
MAMDSPGAPRRKRVMRRTAEMIGGIDTSSQESACTGQNNSEEGWVSGVTNSEAELAEVVKESLEICREQINCPDL